nr:alpha-glucuronidase family glycosyl hydrolase [uncultured Carboxylicivirga sp.]
MLGFFVSIKKVRLKLIVFLLILNLPNSDFFAQDTYSEPEDGYRMWLRYEKVKDNDLFQNYRNDIKGVLVSSTSFIMNSVREELNIGLSGLLDNQVEWKSKVDADGVLVIGTPENSKIIQSLNFESKLKLLGDDGYIIETIRINGHRAIVVAANHDLGLLYGTFGFLKLLQTNRSINDLNIVSKPKIQCRVVNHWDNANRSVERGYAGISLWDWGTLPNFKDPRYTDYARLNASIGINGTVINNVNAESCFITPYYLERIAALADLFRPYGIKVYLSINFNSPQQLGRLNTSDPMDQEVQMWWQEKVKEIYSYIPDFGGFLVKADSEGQPGPNTYGRTHAEGANMLAKALKPYDGIVMWRAFVYGNHQKDRIREAYDEFVPLDGQFDENVIVQIKKGPLDFMPHEPFSPLFGALSKTNTMIEFQVTQEYLGNGYHLVYKGPMYSDILQSDTYAKGKGTTVGHILEGKVFNNSLTGMAGVINPGNVRNWTAHPFVQSSWYAFGRLAWDFTENTTELAEEWIRLTFSNDADVVEKIKLMMMLSAHAAVNYREPLGLTHIGTGNHYGPAPWSVRSRNFHQANEQGIGFDRTETGSNAIAQYKPQLKNKYSNPKSTPDDLLLWFHHLPWSYQMHSGKTLWETLVRKYYQGVDEVERMQNSWNDLKGKIDINRFNHVKALLEIQKRDALQWRNACVLYFQSLSKMPIPKDLETPPYSLDYYKKLEKQIPVPFLKP